MRVPLKSVGLAVGVLLALLPSTLWPTSQALLVAQAQTMPDRKAEADRWLKAGREALQQRQFSVALKHLQSALTLYRQLQDRSGEGNVLDSLGNVYASQQQYQQAIGFYQQVLVIRRKTGDLNGEARTLNNIGAIYNFLGKKAKALEYFNQTLPLLRAVGNRGSEAITLNNIIAVYVGLGEKAKALEYLNQVLPILRSMGDRGGEATTLNHIGDIYSDLGKKAKALEYYNQALPIFRDVDERAGEAKAINNVGGVYSDLGEKQKALEYYNQALLIWRAVDNRGGEATTLNNIGSVYSDLGEKLKALEYYNQALPIWRSVGDLGSEASTFNNIGGVYSDLGEKQKALEYYNQALPILWTMGDRGRFATTLNNIGRVYSDLGEKQKALEYLNQALTILRTGGNRDGEATALSNIGDVYSDLGEKAKALEYYNLALPLRRAVSDRSGEATTLNNIGLAYHTLGENAKALEYYNLALPLRRAVSDRSGEATTLNNIGGVYEGLGKTSKALDYYNQALPICRTVGDRGGEARTLNNIGAVYSALGEKQKALAYYNQALPIHRAVGNRGGEASTLNNIGGVYDALGEKTKALEFYNQALPLYRVVGDREGEAKTLNNIGYAIISQKQPQLAIIFFKQAVSKFESLRTDIRQLPKTTQETYTKTVASTYRQLADLLLQQDRILEAQQILDLLKVQELDTYLKNVRGGTQALYTLPPETEILKQYSTLQTSAIALGQDLTTLRAIPETSRTPAQTQQIAKLIQFQTQLNQQFNQFLDRPDIQKLIAALSPKVLKQTVDTASLDALRDELKQLNAVMIYPLVLSDRLELIITTPDSPPLRRTVNVTRETLNQAILEFRDALQNPRSDPKPSAQKLYNWLIKPLEADLKASNPKTLIYAPDAQLRYIPLAALYDSQQPDGKQWLTSRYAINHITAQSLTNLVAQPSAAPKILAGAIGNRAATIPIANQTFNFGGLPYTTREVQSIQALQPTTQILKDDHFSLPNVQAKMGDYNILHLATHATLVPSQADSSFILFGAQTYATLNDIRSWTLNNFDLVVLSACQTGLGGNFGTNGEEILGLGYQFQSRGARATIASLWQVDDGGTQALMTVFYKALKAQKSKTAALQIAQQAMIRGEFQSLGITRSDIEVTSTRTSKPIPAAQLSHPYYWAPFILIGNGL